MNIEYSRLHDMCIALAWEIERCTFNEEPFYLCYLTNQKFFVSSKYAAVHYDMQQHYGEDAVAEFLLWLDNRIADVREGTDFITLPQMLRAKGVDPKRMHSDCDLRCQWLMAGCPLPGELGFPYSQTEG